jgi:hypothetical protein
MLTKKKGRKEKRNKRGNVVMFGLPSVFQSNWRTAQRILIKIDIGEF